MTNNKKPGDGERSAMLGYVPQYEIAAELIYEALLDGTLEWIRVADPGAGTVDDIQIATTGRLDAYQVKWAEFTKDEFSYKDFIRGSKTKYSLYEQLVQGWKTLKEKNLERNIHVHLIHKQVPSANPQAKLPVGSVIPEHKHFQAFIKDCWLDRSWCSDGLDFIPECWKETFKELKNISGLDNEEFLSFITACELSFNYKNPASIPIENQKQAKRKNDIDKLYKLLTEMAGGEHRIIHLTKDKLLEKLSWHHRFQYKFKHEFPVVQAYQSISETVNALDECLSKIKQGYIALLGTPGTGKSTTLTHNLKYKKGFRLVRYYAFVPDSPQIGRGEASSFLHDITLSLKYHGFHGPRGIQTESREELQALLAEQLQQAHEKWKEDNVVTVIMVDGLDHIQRELNPQRSLLSDLPIPTSVPEGILFILGSQTLELNNLSDAIKVHINNEGRLITMSPLNKQNTYAVIDIWLDNTSLTSNDKNIIYEKSSGHPLSLIYLLQLVSEQTGLSCSELLETAPDYQGHIENSYSVYWESIQDKHSLVELFALLSRIRIPINVYEVEKWVDAKVIKDFILSASHYFRKENDTNWYFFHNSFRQFILDKTSRDLLNNIDESKHIAYHARLANFCSEAGPKSSLYWEQIYHLFNAKKIKEIIDLGQQDYLRSQFFNLRHFENIVDDISYILLSAKELNEPLPVIRSLLIETELRERRQALDQLDILQLLFSTEDLDVVHNYLFDGRRLRVGEVEALEFSKTLIENGFVSEAKLVFDAAEPLAQLSGSEGVGTMHGDSAVVKAWVDIAHHFIDIEKIISTILQTRYEKNDRLSETYDDKDLHFYLIRKLINSVYSSNDEKVNHLLSILGADKQFERHLLDISFSICLDEYPEKEIDNALKRIIAWATTNEISDSYKILIAELILNINHDKNGALKWLDDIEQPELYKYSIGSEPKDLCRFSDRIRLNRLKAALNCDVEPEVAVPNEDDTSYQGNVLFERQLVYFANLWGKSWKGENVDSNTIIRGIKPAFNLFLKSHTETDSWHAWYEINALVNDFYHFAINSIGQHGSQCILDVAKAFRADWQKRYWPTHWRREIALNLYYEGDEKESLISSLDEIEKQIEHEDDFTIRISDYSDLAISWAEIGEKERAKDLLPKIIKESFGIYYHKDRQFSLWVSWLGKIADRHSDIVQDDIRRFAAALVGLELSGRGRGTQEAAKDLIAICASWNIEYGFDLVDWLFNKKGLHYESGLSGLLEGMLKRKDPPCREIVAVANKLLIPFEEYGLSDLPKLLAYSCYKYLSEPDASELIRKTENSISTNLLPSHRYTWREGVVEGLRKAGRDNPEYTLKTLKTPKEKHVTDEPKLVLVSGENLTEEQAKLKVNSSKSLLELIRTVDSSKYFRWAALIEPYIDTMDISQLKDLYDLLVPFSPKSNTISSIAKKLAELDELDKANEILAELLDASDPKGWDLHWDGGSRQFCFKALIAIDPNKWRPIALHSFIDDYIGEYRYPINFIWCLEEIIEILYEEPNLLAIWQEITNHVNQLSDFVEITELPPKPNEKEPNITDVNHLIRFVFRLSDIIVPELELMAHQVIIDFIRNTNDKTSLTEEIKLRLTKIGLTQIKALSVLKSILNESPEYVMSFESELSSLSASEDFCVRLMAMELASQLKISMTSIPNDREQLPFIYKVELPEIKNEDEVIPYAAIKAGETFPDFDDPLEMIRPLSSEVKVISKMSGIPFQNILSRTVEHMKTLAPEENWNNEAEKKYRAWMKGIELELTYHRLRPQIAILALLHVICELIDAGCIRSEDMHFLSVLFRRSDINILNIEPCLRPSYIEVPVKDYRDLMGQHEDWLDECNEALSFFQDIDDQKRIILGELTNCCWLDWDKPLEKRFSMVCHSEWPEINTLHDAYSFFPHEIYWKADDYPNIDSAKDLSLVIYGSPRYVDYGSSKWLALNPFIGARLNWKLSNDGLFRWVNDDGEVMVESISWKDGPINRQPPKLDDVCSNGWLVIATPTAMNEIHEITGEVIKINTVIRSYGRDPYNLNYRTAENRNQVIGKKIGKFSNS